MTDRKIVVFTFAGRQENMEVQAPFLRRLLDTYPGLTVEHWDLTRNDDDHAYVQSLHDPDGRVIVRSDFWPGHNDWPVGCRKRIKRARKCGCKDCRPAPFEKPYAWYAERGEPETVYTKLDDDVLFIETERYGDVLATLDDHPNAVVSANVVNNVVSAKHSPVLRERVEARFSPVTQYDWFMLHTLPEFAQVCHDWFLDDWRPWTAPSPRNVVRVLPGERVSINCISFTHETLVRMAAAMSQLAFRKIGDEGTVGTNFLPRIVRSFTVAHLQFGPQRVGLPESVWDDYRAKYAEVGREYLGYDESPSK